MGFLRSDPFARSFCPKNIKNKGLELVPIPIKLFIKWPPGVIYLEPDRLNMFYALCVRL